MWICNLLIDEEPRWKTEIENNMPAMVDSLMTIISAVVWHLRSILSSFEIEDINSKENDMVKVYALLRIICSRGTDEMVIKFCDAMEKERQPKWTYLKNYCNGSRDEVYDAWLVS